MAMCMKKPKVNIYFIKRSPLIKSTCLLPPFHVWPCKLLPTIIKNISSNVMFKSSFLKATVKANIYCEVKQKDAGFNPNPELYLRCTCPGAPEIYRNMCMCNRYLTRWIRLGVHKQVYQNRYTWAIPGVQVYVRCTWKGIPVLRCLPGQVYPVTRCAWTGIPEVKARCSSTDVPDRCYWDIPHRQVKMSRVYQVHPDTCT